nr:hypothetical protein [Tanacetum cinerariifolium]
MSKVLHERGFGSLPCSIEMNPRDHVKLISSIVETDMTPIRLVKNMDGYRDQDMGDIILGEPFCKASCVEAKRLNGILHPYQKLKSFYKEVLNLGPEHVRDAKMEEWLIRGDVTVHEMK